MTNGLLYNKIKELKDKYLKVWMDICEIESPTNCKQGVDAVGKYIIQIANELGFQVEIFNQEKSGNVICIDMNKNINEKPICLSAHMDVVFPIGSIIKSPIRIEGDKLFALGSCDCKGGIVLAMMVMEALKSVNYINRPVRFLLQSDEENSSLFSNKKTINYICEKAKDSVAFLNLEGGEEGLACMQRKGILNLTLTVVGKESHASFCAIKGANAICEMAYKIIELEKLKDDDGITCNCGVIEGGTARNTVAGSCNLQINIRYATEEQKKTAIEYVEKIANTTYIDGCFSSLQIDSSRVAMELTDKNIALLNKINKIFVQNGFSQLKPSKSRGGSDAANTTAFGIPTIDKLGPVGGAIHTTNEFAYISSLVERAQRLATIIYCFDQIL